MIFYNGFNLVIDLAIAGFVYLWAHGVGYRKGLWKNKPPFQKGNKMVSSLVWSSEKKVMEKKMQETFSVWIVLEDCCGHFSGVFATEAEAFARVEEYGDGHSYFERLI